MAVRDDENLRPDNKNDEEQNGEELTLDMIKKLLEDAKTGNTEQADEVSGEEDEDFDLYADVLGDDDDTIDIDCDPPDEGFKDADDYHNEAVNAMHRDDPEYAVRITVKGLNRFPDNADLLADRIAFLMDLGDKTGAAAAYEELKIKLPGKKWNWRAYLFSIEFMTNTDAAGFETECRDLIARFKANIPYDERADYAECLFERELGNEDRSLEVLENAVRTRPNAAQCAFELCNRYLTRGMYNEALEAADYALAASCAKHEPFNTGYLLFMRTLARDYNIHMKAYKCETVTAEEIESVKSDYMLIAESFKDDVKGNMSVILTRTKLLRALRPMAKEA